MGQSEGRAAPTEKEAGRLESFSDGVFAVAITLLVLNLVVPELRAPTAAALASALREQWPSYLAFATSFGTILIMWVNHHAIFKLVQRADTLLMFANGFLLLVVTVVPFETALVARYLGTPAATTACAIYAGGFAVGNIAYNLLWVSIAHARRLLHPHVPQARVDRLTMNFLTGFPIYLGATALAFWNAYASISVCFCLWIFWAMTGYERTPARDPQVS
jgi:TMEM175 potassium channel family protein